MITLLLIFTASGCIVATLYLVLVVFRKKNIESLQGKHVIVTGGSQGLGKQLAKLYFRHGSKVTLMARTESKLITAKNELLALKSTENTNPSGSVEYVCVDVKDYADVLAAMKRSVCLQNNLPIDTLICCTGAASTGYLLDFDPKIFEEQMLLNYMGPVNCVKAVVPMMIESQTKGEILFIASAITAASLIGYSAYAPAKSALRSFCDAIRNELRGFGIGVHIAYPPDMDTPGFLEENKTKPKETLEICPPDVYSTKKCADSILNGMLCGEYHIYSPDFVQNLLISSVVNITPRGRWAVIELLLAPIIGLVCLGFRFHADRVASQYGERVLKRMVHTEEKNFS